MIQALRNFIVRRTFAYKLRNKAMNMFSSFENFQAIRKKAEDSRVAEGRKHEVLYFHKVDDPYSHLTVHYIEKFKNAYNVKFRPVLVGEENLAALHEPSLYTDYCLEDVKRIAPYYGVDFPGTSYPEINLVKKANSILSSVSSEEFAPLAKIVSRALWSGDSAKLEELEAAYKTSEEEVLENLKKGNEIRNDYDYYFGSAFYYEKELYWGVDRLNHLEDRLIELGVNKSSDNEPVCLLQTKAPETMSAEKKVNLTYYPSLNSPYTFVSAKRVKEFQDQYPINLITRPVLPMLMRMMVIPDFKGKYIISDAAREGRKYGYEMKEIFSPIGKPARKAYSLFPVIDSMGKGFEYIDELLKASFQEGINIGDNNYLKNTVTGLGLDWDSVKKDLNTSKWKKVLNDNVHDMYQGNCWGVPSFKITDADGSNPYYVWGQDRMWLLKEEINRRLT
jgi:2-hydroxychromene-2-carboxylate isomerase